MSDNYIKFEFEHQGKGVLKNDAYIRELDFCWLDGFTPETISSSHDDLFMMTKKAVSWMEKQGGYISDHASIDISFNNTLVYRILNDFDYEENRSKLYILTFAPYQSHYIDKQETTKKEIIYKVKALAMEKLIEVSKSA